MPGHQLDSPSSIARSDQRLYDADGANRGCELVELLKAAARSTTSYPSTCIRNGVGRDAWFRWPRKCYTWTCRMNLQVNNRDLSALCQRHHIKKLAVFGSAARDELRSDS